MFISSRKPVVQPMPSSKPVTAMKKVENFKSRLAGTVELMKAKRTHTWSLGFFDSSLQVVNDAFTFAHAKWDPKSDPLVVECVSRLRSCVNEISLNGVIRQRRERLDVIKGMLIEPPPTQPLPVQPATVPGGGVEEGECVDEEDNDATAKHSSPKESIRVNERDFLFQVHKVVVTADEVFSLQGEERVGRFRELLASIRTALEIVQDLGPSQDIDGDALSQIEWSIDTALRIGDAERERPAIKSLVASTLLPVLSTLDSEFSNLKSALSRRVSCQLATDLILHCTDLLSNDPIHDPQNPATAAGAPDIWQYPDHQVDRARVSNVADAHKDVRWRRRADREPDFSQ